ncbi:MAG: hypothetical protein ACI9VT_003785 [Psychroserpens sp.]|jgi:hypothetical protein
MLNNISKALRGPKRDRKILLMSAILENTGYNIGDN